VPAGGAATWSPGTPDTWARARFRASWTKKEPSASPQASRYKRIGMPVRVRSQRKRVLLCGKSLRQRNIGRPSGRIMIAGTVPSTHGGGAAPPVAPGGRGGPKSSVSKRNDRPPVRSTQTSVVLSRGSHPRPHRSRAEPARAQPGPKLRDSQDGKASLICCKCDDLCRNRW
jgi:hypothetical protein